MGKYDEFDLDLNIQSVNNNGGDVETYATTSNPCWAVTTYTIGSILNGNCVSVDNVDPCKCDGGATYSGPCGSGGILI